MTPHLQTRTQEYQNEKHYGKSWSQLYHLKYRRLYMYIYISYTLSTLASDLRAQHILVVLSV